MKFKKLIIVLSVILFSNTFIISQTTQKQRTEPLKAAESLEYIASDLQSLSEKVETLNKEIVKAFSKISSSLGLSLTENQQKLLVSFEILNRAEQRLGNLQKLKIELVEKLTSVKSRLNEVENELTLESLDRSVSLIGTTNAEELRESRRRLLGEQKNDLNDLLLEIQSTISQTNTELRATTQLVDRIRNSLFPAIYRELPRLDNDDQ